MAITILFGKPAPRVFRGVLHHFYLEGSKTAADSIRKKLKAIGKRVRIVKTTKGKYRVYADGRFKFVEGGVPFKKR